MKELYEVSINIGNKPLKLKVKAKSLKKATKKVMKAPLLAILDRLKVEDVVNGYSTSLIEDEKE